MLSHEASADLAPPIEKHSAPAMLQHEQRLDTLPPKFAPILLKSHCGESLAVAGFSNALRFTLKTALPGCAGERKLLVSPVPGVLLYTLKLLRCFCTV